MKEESKDKQPEVPVVRPYQHAISEETATMDDEWESEKIVKILKDDYNLYETETDRKKRETILAQLNEIVKDWIRKVGIKEGKDEEII